MIIYVDILFLENMILDFIIILATGMICNHKLKWKRIILSSIISSLCTVMSIIWQGENLYGKILQSLLVIFIAFGFRNSKRFLKNLIVFYLITITFGGASFLLLFSVTPQNIVYQAGHFLGLYPVKMAILGGILGFALILTIRKILEEKREKTCKIEIGWQGEKIETIALIDSRKFIERGKIKPSSYYFRRKCDRKNHKRD